MSRYKEIEQDQNLNFNPTQEKPEARPRITECGTLSDGRRVLRLNGSSPDVYGFYIANQSSKILPLNTERALKPVNEFLTQLSLPPIERLPELCAVINPQEKGSGKNKTGERIQFLNVESALERTTLVPKREENEKKPGHQPLGGREQNPTPPRNIPLEGNLSMQEREGKLSIVDGSSEEQYASHWRRISALSLYADHLSNLVPQLHEIQDKKWRNNYAKELWRRIIESALPEKEQLSSYGVVGLTASESQKLTLQLDDWVETLLARNPQSHWEDELAETLRKMDPNREVDPNDFPPHMKISTPTGKRLYLAATQLATKQEATYRQIARHRKQGGNGNNGDVREIQITAEDVRGVADTITQDEIQEYVTAEKRNSNEEDNKLAEHARHFISHAGIPHQWAGLSHEELARVTTSSNPLRIEKNATLPKREQGDGMFTRAAHKEIVSPDKPKWGAEVQSPLTPDQVAQVLGLQAKTPLVDPSRLDIDPSRIESPEDTAGAIWRILKCTKIEKKGTNVRTPEGEQEFVKKITTAVENGQPVDILLFGPWGTAPSRLRSGGRIFPHLGHLDYLVRFSRINSTVEQVYKPKAEQEPAIRFNWVNESDAFVGAIDKRGSQQIADFEARMKTWLRIINPERELFNVYHFGELLWDTPEKRALYEEFHRRYQQEATRLFDQYEKGGLTDKKQESWVREKVALIYPIATIIDPYDYLPPETPLDKIAVAYELVRARVQGKEQGFKSSNGYVDAHVERTADTLYGNARDLVTHQYVPIMDSRYHTADYLDPERKQQYEQVNPWRKLYEGKLHGRITDGGTNRWWVRLNSGDSTIHPTHGCAVINSPLENEKDPSMTIMTYAEILTEPERYAPVYLQKDEDKPFHFIQLK